MPTKAEANAIVKKVKASVKGAVVTHTVFAGEPLISVKREHLKEVCTVLKNDPELAFDYPCDVTCVDYPQDEQRFEVIHVLWSMEHRHRVILKTRVSEGDPTVDTVTDLWKGANFMEREVYDLYGVRFTGHPDLRRIMMTDDFEGHPLRKDFPIEGFGWRENYDFIPQIGD